MTVKKIVFGSLLSIIAAPALAGPTMTVVPQGLQGGNWVWQVNITADQTIVSGGTPLNVEMGFRLTGDPLVSVTNLSPLIFDTNTAGKVIFGWETSYGSPPFPEGVEANCAACIVTNAAIFGGHASTVVPGSTNEIFSTLGSIDTSLSTPIPFLRIVAQGPATGGPQTSTIQWLGAYSGKGRISQIVGTNAQNFDTFAGAMSQTVPEPTSVVLVSGAAFGLLALSRRRSARV